jgi:hypothetical protein
MQFDERQIFEVRRDGDVFHYATNDLVCTAVNEGLNFYEFADMEKAREAFDEVPAELAALLEKGPAVEITEDGGDGSRFVAEEKLNRTEEAIAYLSQDLSAMLIIDSTEEAEAELSRPESYWAAYGASAWEIRRKIADMLRDQISFNGERSPELAAECRRILAAAGEEE